METNKTSWDRLKEFDTRAALYLTKHPQMTRTTYALDRVVAQIPKIQEKVRTKWTTIEVLNCETSEPEGKGRLLKEGADLVFTQAGRLKANAEIEAHNAAAEYEIEPHFVPVADDLREIEIQAFLGLILRQEDVDTWRAKIEAGFDEAEKASTQPTAAGENHANEISVQPENHQ